VGWVEHVVAAMVMAALVVFLWRPATAASIPEKEDRVGEMAALLGEHTPSPDAIERILPTVSRFPPSESATRSLADALSACDMSSLSESSRVQLARRIYATTMGGDMTRDRLAVILNEIQDEAIRARCSPIAITAIVDSARRVARTDPKPRRNWW
jgi:hypothetical protein